MTSLRARLVEAGARAIWDEWDSLDDLEALDPDGKANALADIEIVLDAFLDTLAETYPRIEEVNGLTEVLRDQTDHQPLD